MSEVGRQRMTSRILADIVQCHVHFFHLTVSIQVAFSLHTSKHEVLHAFDRGQQRHLGERLLRIPRVAEGGEDPDNLLPGIRATRLHLDASCFFVQHVPWQFFISLVLLRHHAERRKEAQQIGAEIIFFNPGYKSQQMERILVLEVACRHL